MNMTEYRQIFGATNQDIHQLIDNKLTIKHLISRSIKNHKRLRMVKINMWQPITTNMIKTPRYPIPRPSNSNAINALKHLVKTRQPVRFKNNTCMICLVEFGVNPENEIILQCGHRFHWHSAKCRGLYNSDITACPICRKLLN